MIDRIKRIWAILGEDMNQQESENGVNKNISRISIVLSLVGVITTILNIIQHKTLGMTIATTIIAVGFFATYISVAVFKNRYVSSAIAIILAGVIFTYFTISGGNEGFAVLWTLLVPSAMILLVNVRMGLILSVYFLTLVIVLFYTPLRTYMAQYYTPTFLNRYPLIYLCSTCLSYAQSLSYHKALIKQRNLTKAQATFLANVSHEIRTPINGIMGMNKLIMDENTSPSIAEYSKNVERSSKMLLSIVNDILDFSKLDQGKFEIVEGEYKLLHLLEDLEWLIKEQVDSNVKLVSDYDNSLPAVLVGDEIRLKQVILNILSNAAKYTHKGQVLFMVKGIGAGEDFKLHIEVADTGIGMRAEDIPHIFESFRRLDALKNRGVMGTGLGLPIAKLLVECMKGTITVESELGVGTTFIIEIPQKIVDNTPINDYKYESAKEVVDEIKDFSGFSILAVDDNSVNLAVIKGFLKKLGATPVTAKSGLEAIECTKKQKFDLILMDHMMPEMDGVEALHNIRDDAANENAATKIVVVTANAVTGMKEQYLEEGFDNYISKPIQFNELSALLAKYLYR